MTQRDLFEHEDQWHPPSRKGACGRDPSAGPGTCHHWWDGCPRAEARGCYLLWRRRQQVSAEGAQAPTAPGASAAPAGARSAREARS